jgi:hypothetical protein
MLNYHKYVASVNSLWSRKRYFTRKCIVKLEHGNALAGKEGIPEIHVSYPQSLHIQWNVNARLMCSIPCMMILFYSQMSQQNKYHFNRVDSGLCGSINLCIFFTSVFLLPEQMRSLKMKQQNFKRCDSDAQNTLWRMC